MTVLCLIFVYLSALILFLSRELQSKKTTTTKGPGAWSSWTEWSDCSKTCGVGVRRRTRTCNYEGFLKALRCKGKAGQMTNCDTGVTCPVHGGWTAWVAWECSVTCGGGSGLQKRTCTNPRPMFGGADCEGSAEDRGRCNKQKCPDQVHTLSPAAAQAVKHSMDNEYHNFEKHPGGSVRVPCSAAAVSKIFEDYPRTSLLWTKDGQVLRYDHERMEIAPTELLIRGLGTADGGIYVCSVHYAPQVVRPVTVTAVAVASAVEVPAEESIRLACRGVQLAKIYKNATHRWLLDGREVKSFGSVSPIENNVYEIEEVKKNMSGRWSCRIRDPQTGREWTTNVVAVRVLPAVPKFLRFLSNRNVLLTMGIVLFVLVMLAGAVFGYVITKTREDFAGDFEKWSQIARWEEARAGGLPQWAAAREEGSETEDEV